MSTEIISKNTAVLNKVPALSQLTRGEIVVAHRADETNNEVDIVDTVLGVFIRVGRTADDVASDKLVRIGPAIVTSGLDLPTQVGIENAPDKQDWTGQLWWRASTKEFLINTDGTDQGWESVIPARQEASSTTAGSVILATLSDIYKGESDIKVVSAAGLRKFLDGVEAGTTFLAYVDPGNPNSSDAKSNRGNNPNRPFKSPQRALLEVTRRSFVRNTPGNPTPNDRTERMAVYLAPAVYELYNGPGGEVDLASYGRYRDAARLILLNRDFLADEALAAIPAPSRTDTCRRDIYFYIDGLSNDIAARSDVNTIRNAKFVRNPNGSFIPAYDSPTERSETRLALVALRAAAKDVIKNLGPVKDLTIPVDPSPNPCENVQDSIDNLIDILDLTLESGGTGINPHNLQPDPGFVSASFPNEGEPTPQNLQGFNNNLKGGIILPRGVSIIGPDLRKVVFRPKYVPAADGSEGKAAIFRMTGSNFFQGFTIKDCIGQSESAHNLACFNFATQAELQNYYDKVATVFNDPSYFHQQQDAANLILSNVVWIERKIKESILYTGATATERGSFDRFAIDVIAAISKDLRASTNTEILKAAAVIFSTYSELAVDNPTRLLLEDFWPSIITSITDYCKVALRNAALPSEGGFVDSSVIADSENFSNPCINVQVTVENFGDIITAVLLDEVPAALNIARFGINDVEPNPAENEIVGPVSSNSVPNTVDGASPYIFSASLRSIWGMSGIDGDGNDVTGFKSYVAAQFTIVSLQTDASAFTTTPPITGEVASKRYKGTRSSDAVDYRNVGYAVRNEAYAQLVSCFCIGPAIHYHCTGGAEFSITNSTSNFGDVSLQAEGFVGEAGTGGAYAQDRGYKWLSIVRPRLIDRSNPRKPSIGSYVSRTANSITLSGDIDFADIEPYTLVPGSCIYINFISVAPGASTPTIQTLSATVAAPGVNRNSLVKNVIPISSFNGSWPTNAQLEGLSIFIQRLVDDRSEEDRIFKLRVQAPVLSRGRPLENFIFRFNHSAPVGSPTHQRQLAYAQDEVAYVAKSVLIDEPNRIYEITLLSGFADTEGVANSNLSYYPTINLDFDPLIQGASILDSPTDSLTYLMLNRILTELGYSLSTRNSILVGSATDFTFAATPTDLRPEVEFNKPSVIRCGSHTWEYLGYYNYDTALPIAQSSILGAGLSAAGASELKLSKLQKERGGGRIYATGLNEEGDFFIGPTRINTRTGQSSDTRLESSATPDLQVFTRVNVVQTLTLLPNSVLRLQAASTLKFDSGSKLDVSTDPETLDTGVKAYYQSVSGIESRRYGLARPATTFEAVTELSTDNRSNFISPANLAEWRNAKQLVSLRDNSVPIYVGTWNGVSGVAYTASYNGNFWPEPAAPIVALSQNPGLPFRPFNTLASAAAWANANLQPTETAVLYMQKGYHSLAATFRCNVILNGIGNTDVSFIDTGNYNNTQTESVLLYSPLTVEESVMDFGTNTGRQFLSAITTAGRLSILGLGTSRISNVAIVSPIQAYSAIRGGLSTRSAIEDILRVALDQKYTNFNGGVDEYLLTNAQTAGRMPADRISWVFQSALTRQQCISKTGGILSISRVIFGPQGPYYSSRSVFETNNNACIELRDGADLRLQGISIRGNEVFAVPKQISGLPLNSLNSYQIANTAPSGTWENFLVGAPGTEVPQASIPWIHHSYESNKDGAPTGGGTYVAVFGHCSVFIVAPKGNATISTRAAGERPSGTFANFNDDRNNIRLESNFSGLYNVGASDRGSGSLGVAGTVNSAVLTDIYNEIMGLGGGAKRGPLINNFIAIMANDSNVFLPQTYTGQQNGIAGWRGAFGYIPKLNLRLAEGSSFKCTGVAFVSGPSNPLASGINLTRQVSDFWATAANSIPTSGTTAAIVAANARNVFWRIYEPGFYPGPDLPVSMSNPTNTTRQTPSTSDTDTSFYATPPETNRVLIFNFTFTGTSAVI
jgi:hypothetical protein